MGLLTAREPSIALGTKDPLGLFTVNLPLRLFDTHMYIVGKTKKGKSSFMLNLALQLIQQGQGLGLIDPHGDLVTDLISHLATQPRDAPYLTDPDNRRRIIYFDPTITQHPIPLNPLANHSDRPFTVAQTVVEGFKRTWHDELKVAPRFENLTLYSLIALIENQLSLAQLPRFLTETSYRHSQLDNVQNRRVLEFFYQRFNRWGKERALMIESLLNKVTTLLINDYLYPILSAKSCLNLRQIMDNGNILLVNLKTQENQTKHLLGSLLMSMFEQAAQSRDQNNRRPFYLLVDEFQKFCANEGSAATLAEILSECRKFGLHLCFAHQSWAQVDSHSRLVGALEQAQIKVIFGTGRQTAQAIVGELYKPEPEKIKHEVEDSEQQNRTHPLFTPLNEQYELYTQRIQRLKRRQIIVQLPDQDETIQLKTPTISSQKLAPKQITRIKYHLAKQYAVQPARQVAKPTKRQENWRQGL